MIPFVDVKLQDKFIKSEIKRAIDGVLESSKYILGPQLEKFENSFAKYCNKKFAVGLNSGTDALILSLKALGIGQNDEVITVANSFIATTASITVNQAKPIFVDIDPKTYNIDVGKIKERITKKTKAILPVHLFGQPAEMKQISHIAKKHNLYVIEDVCQANGALHYGKIVPFTDIGCFSFYPSKNLGTYGDAGAVVTNNKQLALKIKELRNHGSPKRDYHSEEGVNSRLDEIQAAILNVKLKYLDKWNIQRRKCANQYDRLLKNVIIPVIKPSNQSSYCLYVIRSKNRDKIQQALKEKDISALIHYPVPIHKQKAYREFNHLSLPITEKYADEMLSLPIFPGMTPEQIEKVCQIVNQYA